MFEAGEVKYFSFIKNREFGFEFEGEMALLRFDLRSFLGGDYTRWVGRGRGWVRGG